MNADAPSVIMNSGYDACGIIDGAMKVFSQGAKAVFSRAPGAHLTGLFKNLKNPKALRPGIKDLMPTLTISGAYIYLTGKVEKRR